MPKPVFSLLRNEAGATSLEYGLIAALMSVAIIVAIALLDGEFQSVFQRVVDAL